MKTVFVIYGENEETRPNVLGIASSKEKADKLIEELDEIFDEIFEYFVHEIAVDILNPNGFALYE
jgi:hypothetical protein